VGYDDGVRCPMVFLRRSSRRVVCPFDWPLLFTAVDDGPAVPPRFSQLSALLLTPTPCVVSRLWTFTLHARRRLIRPFCLRLEGYTDRAPDLGPRPLLSLVRTLSLRRGSAHRSAIIRSHNTATPGDDHEDDDVEELTE
jgi:hypothetical protein